MASWQFSTKFFVYGLIGGFYHSKRFAPRTKYIWLLLNVVAFFITIILGCYGYWITTDQKTVADKAFILATASINLFSIVVVPVITYQYSHDLETILDFVEIEWSKPTINESRARRREARKYLIYAIAMDSTVALVVITLHPALMLWYGPSKLHSLQHYIYPVPHIRRIDTFLAYFSITSVHCACAVLIVSVLVVVPPFLMILAFEFYVAFAINGDLLQKFQAQVRSDFEECHEKYSYVESAQHLQAFRQDVAYLQLRLLRGLSKASRDHQDLRRKIKIIKPFIEVFFSLFLPWFVMASVSLTYVYLSQKLTLLQKIKTLGILTGWTIMMFSFTHVGKLFDDMEDEFFENVSGFPWYYLEPKQRKTFYIFLNQTMHPVRFYAFTMYSLVPITFDLPDRSRTNTRYRFAKYIMYGWSGGFYHCQEFKSWMKYTWMAINTIAFVIILVMGCFGYWITTENKSFADKAFALAIASTNFFAILGMPAMNYYFRKELEMILHFVEQEYSTKTFNEMKIRHRALRHVCYAFAMGFFVASTYILLHPALMLLYGSTKLHSLQHYLYPVPWLDQIDSLTIYFLISLVHCTCASFTISVMVTLPPFLMMIAFEFYFAFTIIGNSLEQFGEQLQSTLEERFSANSYHLTTKEIENYQQKLLTKVTTTARDHQQILRKIKLIKPFIEILFSQFLPCFVAASCFLIYMYLSENLTLLQKIKTMGIVGGWTIMMFSFTHAGKLFADMEETFSDVVYGFPWYYLNPKQRRTYYIFLNQTKHPVRFNALSMYSMVPMTSLNCLKLIYSFSNLMRNQINRKQVK